MMLPCMVKRALNCAKLSSEECGEVSCSRMIRAITPEM